MISMTVCVMFSFKNTFVHVQYIFEHHRKPLQKPCAFWILENFHTFVYRKWSVARVSISAFLGIFHWAITVTYFTIDTHFCTDGMFVTVTTILTKFENESVDIVRLCCVQTSYRCVIGFSGWQEWQEEEKTEGEEGEAWQAWWSITSLRVQVLQNLLS